MLSGLQPLTLGAGADSLDFSGAVAGATISGTDTAGDVALLTLGTNTAVFSAVGNRCSGELRWQRRHGHLQWSRWCRLDLRRHPEQTLLDFDGAVGAATIGPGCRG